MPVFIATWCGWKRSYGKKLLPLMLQSSSVRFHKERDNMGRLQTRIAEGVRKCGRRMSGSSSYQSYQFWMSPSGLLLGVLTGSRFSIPGELTGATAAEAAPEAKLLPAPHHNVHEWPSTCKTGFGCLHLLLSRSQREAVSSFSSSFPCCMLPVPASPIRVILKLFSLNILEV